MTIRTSMNFFCQDKIKFGLMDTNYIVYNLAMYSPNSVLFGYAKIN